MCSLRGADFETVCPWWFIYYVSYIGVPRDEAAGCTTFTRWDILVVNTRSFIVGGVPVQRGSRLFEVGRPPNLFCVLIQCEKDTVSVLLAIFFAFSTRSWRLPQQAK